MRRKTTVVSGLILCLLFGTLLDRSLSQTQAPKSPEEQQRWFHEQRLKDIERQAEFQRKAEEQRVKSLEQQKAMRKIQEEYTEEAYQEALGATAEQWQAIRPRLERIKQLQIMPRLDISTYAVSAAGSLQSGGFTSTSDGGHSTANTSGQVSATRGVNPTSDSSTRSGTAGGYGRSFNESGANLRLQLPGPVKKQVGDMNLGWQWRRPSLNKNPGNLSESEKACEQLLETLETEKPSLEQTRQQVEGLRRVRQQRQAELQQARQPLRALVTPEQEAKLILMGYPRIKTEGRR
jgi:hypothetical protein